MNGTDRRIYDTTTDPSRGRIRREVVSALGLLVVLFNLFAGPLLASRAGANGAPAFDEIFGDRIVVCTAAGMIVFDADGHPVPQNGAEPMCAFCLPLMQGTSDTPVVVTGLDAPPTLTVTVPLAQTSTAPATPRRIASTSPRGPPLV